MIKSRSLIFCLFISLLFSYCKSGHTPKSEEFEEGGDIAHTLEQKQEDTSVLKTDTIPLPVPEKVQKEDTITAAPDIPAEKEASPKWPVKTPPILKDAILPGNRIVAFYGNLYSKKMGILGEFTPDIVLSKLKEATGLWQRADSSKNVVPALELISVSGQGVPMRDSMYRMRMPSWMVDSVLHMAESIRALVILDIQVGWSTVQKEIPYFEEFLKLPNVHLAVDPEFSMKDRTVPGKKIGTMDASDINFCVDYLKQLVKENNLPPKVLIVHRFTQGMVTNYQSIKLQPEVQIVMNMDGFGAQSLKKDTYRRYIYREPVEYTGIKLFYKNDNANGHRMMTPEEVLELHPQPVYVQYQ